MPSQWPRHLPGGLRARITVAFATAALVLAVVLAIAVWSATTGYLREQRMEQTLRQAATNAALVDAGLSRPSPAVPQLLAGLYRGTGSESILSHQGEWYASSLAITPTDLPEGMRETVTDGTAARQRIEVRAAPNVVLGLPLPRSGAAYFEVFPLDDLDRTYRVLAVTLLAGVAVAPTFGLAVGLWASRRALRPLTEVTQAAAVVARGEPGARIDAAGDKDLAPLAASFNATAEALEDRLARDRRFASDVSHELRGPLTTLVGAADVLQVRRASLPPEGREALDALIEEVHRFERLVQDLLEITRDSAPLDIAEVRLAELLGHVLPAKARAVLQLGDSVADVRVLADKRRLERVLANLVDNANSHGGGLVRICVERQVPDRVLIVVEDAGVGVATADRERIFERFARVGRGEQARTPGVGLGLALVRQHVAAHGGEVRVEDRAGGGARFVVELPVAPQ